MTTITSTIPNEDFVAMLAQYDAIPDIDCGIVMARTDIPLGGRVSACKIGTGEWEIYFHYNSARGDGEEISLEALRGDKDNAVNRAWSLRQKIVDGKDPRKLGRPRWVVSSLTNPSPIVVNSNATARIVRGSSRKDSKDIPSV